MKKRLYLIIVFLISLFIISCSSPFSKGGISKLLTYDFNSSEGNFYKGSQGIFNFQVYFGEKSKLKITTSDIPDGSYCFRIYGGFDNDYFWGYGIATIIDNSTCSLELVYGQQGDEQDSNIRTKLIPTKLTCEVFANGQIIKISGTLGYEGKETYRVLTAETCVLH